MKAAAHSRSREYRLLSIESTAEFLAHKIAEESLTILCGAGISRNSGLPSASELARAVLETITRDPRHGAKILSNKLPFEAFVEILDRYLPVGRLLRLFSLGDPNTIHLLIGKLFNARLMKVAFTTNFDVLIERGYATGLSRHGQTLRVVSSEQDIRDFGRLSAAPNLPTLVKLHGTIDRPRTIKATLSRVARRSPGSVLAPTIKYLFNTGEHSTVLIAGYSCSDRFDINPLLPNQARGSKEIIYIRHPLEAVSADYFKSELLPAIFEGYSGQTVVCDASSLLKEVWRRLVPRAGPVLVTPVSTTNWTTFIQSWKDGAVPRWTSLGTRAGGASLHLALADLLSDVGEPDSAVRGFLDIASWAKKSRDGLLESLAYMKASECHMNYNPDPKRF